MDYTATSGTVTFPANSVSGATQTFIVVIEDDSLLETTETYTVSLSNITGLTTILDGIATGTITDNDASIVSISVTNQASESNSNGLFTLTLTNAYSESENLLHN